HAYAEHGALNRRELLAKCCYTVRGTAPTAHQLEDMVNSYGSYYEAHRSEIPLAPGFWEFYRRFQHRHRFIIVSNAPRAEVVSVATGLGIAGCFERFYGAPTSKIAAMREIIHDFNVASAAVLCVGDRVEDRIVAESVGARFCCIDPDRNTASDPYHSVRDFNGLATVLYDFDAGIGSGSM
ncbi:HAD family hydrolase, partial [Nocardia gipuzkoensis]